MVVQLHLSLVVAYPVLGQWTGPELLQTQEVIPLRQATVRVVVNLLQTHPVHHRNPERSADWVVVPEV